MEFDREEFIKVYDELKSSRKVAEYFGCSKTPVLQYAKQIGYDNSKNATFKDETGKRYGSLLVLERAENDNLNRAQWKCQCDCGATTVVLGYKLRQGQKSCGCQQFIGGKMNKIDELGNRYGKLLVIEEAEERSNTRQIMWKCRCDCGNIVIVQGNHLRSGHTSSCGCIKSRGEQRIQEVLQNNNILYRTQQTFDDLLSPAGFNLYFDFAIYNDNKITHLIEYDGEQHFKETSGWNSVPLEYRQQCDSIKNDFAEQYQIPLLRIKYNEYDNIEQILKQFLLN